MSFFQPRLVVLLSIVLIFTTAVLPLFGLAISSGLSMLPQKQSMEGAEEIDDIVKAARPGFSDLALFSSLKTDFCHPVVGSYPKHPPLLYVLGNLRI